MTVRTEGTYAHVRSRDMEWTKSPSATVWRKRLFHRGGEESGVVTSVVRYEEGSTFHRHEHPLGEEILVLEGTFEDERGEHPAGTFMLNPEGYGHAPKSPGGCLLFVRLQQYPNDAQMRLDTTRGFAAVPGFEKFEALDLYKPAEGPAHYTMWRLESGAELAPIAVDHGEELFVVAGEMTDGDRSYVEGDWVRYPGGSSYAPRTEEEAKILVKRFVR